MGTFVRLKKHNLDELDYDEDSVYIRTGATTVQISRAMKIRINTILDDEESK
jgi:hypothetical protein